MSPVRSRPVRRRRCLHHSVLLAEVTSKWCSVKCSGLFSWSNAELSAAVGCERRSRLTSDQEVGDSSSSGRAAETPAIAGFRRVDGALDGQEPFPGSHSPSEVTAFSARLRLGGGDMCGCSRTRSTRGIAGSEWISSRRARPPACQSGRAVRMVVDHGSAYDSPWAVIQVIVAMVGCGGAIETYRTKTLMNPDPR